MIWSFLHMIGLKRWSKGTYRSNYCMKSKQFVPCVFEMFHTNVVVASVETSVGQPLRHIHNERARGSVRICIHRLYQRDENHDRSNTPRSLLTRIHSLSVARPRPHWQSLQDTKSSMPRSPTAPSVLWRDRISRLTIHH